MAYCTHIVMRMQLIRGGAGIALCQLRIHPGRRAIDSIGCECVWVRCGKVGLDIRDVCLPRAVLGPTLKNKLTVENIRKEKTQ